MITINDLRQDDLISFVYNGGQMPGTVRRVCVIEVDNNNIKAYDIDKQGFRNYCFSRMANVRVDGHQSLDLYLIHLDAIKVNQALRHKYGLLNLDIIEDVIAEYRVLKDLDEE